MATGEALGRIARGAPPALDVAALLDGERDVALASLAMAARAPLTRAEAVALADGTPRQHGALQAQCPADLGLRLCAVRLARHGGRVHALAIRRFLGAHALIGELRDQVARPG